MAGYSLRCYDSIADARRENPPTNETSGFAFVGATGKFYTWASTSTTADDGGLTTFVPDCLLQADATYAAGRYTTSATAEPGDFLTVQTALGAATSAVGFNGQRVKDLGYPTAGRDGISLGYLTGSLTGLQTKTACVAATTANIASLAAASVVHDGITLTAAQRLLVKNQSTASQNGIYTVGVVTLGIAALTRATDADSAAELALSQVTISSGTVSSGLTYILPLLTADITLNTTALTFVLSAPVVGSQVGMRKAQKITVGFAATTDGTSALATTQTVSRVVFKVTSVYDAGTLDVGQVGHTTDFVNHAGTAVPAGFGDLSTLAAGQSIELPCVMTPAIAGVVRVSIAGASSGAGVVLVEYGDAL